LKESKETSEEGQKAIHRIRMLGELEIELPATSQPPIARRSKFSELKLETTRKRPLSGQQKKGSDFLGCSKDLGLKNATDVSVEIQQKTRKEEIKWLQKIN
jgi:hypothetical protein